MPNSTDIVTDVGRRLRDPTNFAHSSAVLTRFIDQVQRVINFSQELVLSTVSFAPAAKRTLYQNVAIANDMARIVTIRHNTRNLIDVPWRSLVHNDSRWYRRIGARYELFSRVGNDLFVLYPALATPQNVEIVYSTITPTPGGSQGDVVIPNEFVTNLRDVVEMLALLRGRRLAEATAIATRVGQFSAQKGHEAPLAAGDQ